MTQTLIIEGREIGVKATGLTPLLYNQLTHSDIFEDFTTLQNILQKEGKITGEARAIIENMAYTMHKQYDKSVPSFEEWLDSFENPLVIVDMALPIVKFWSTSMATSVDSKKK